MRYEYLCPDCKKNVVLKRRIEDRHKRIECPWGPTGIDASVMQLVIQPTPFVIR
ncbi:hypothetical protein LCGC14_0736080 [marine sediment metagenome]|uniref:Uncharacterized protein n=1 Tax=marine sediment metagenome TaxID=412755 RepID=A0A0F9ST16_9ZZZZ